MKRMFLVLTVLLCTTVNVLAQEVHGVESKMVCSYDCNPNGTWANWGSNLSEYRGDGHFPWFAYEFTNLNSISVSVEVELYHKVLKHQVYTHPSDQDVYEYEIVATKYFVLRSGESYIFKTSEEGIDRYQYNPYGNYPTKNHNSYYVKYKAYKLI